MPDHRGRIRVCVVTGSRSEYGLLRPVLAALRDHPEIALQLAVTGSHLARERGQTVREIEADGFTIDATVDAPLDFRAAAGVPRAMGTWTAGFGDVFARLSPDLVVVMGDRYEILAVCAACVAMAIPLGHISGGEVTEGAIDEQIRHAITKMAHLHFVANEIYGARVHRMGEEAWRVCVSGEPGLDTLPTITPTPRAALEADLGLALSLPTALVTFHPVTLEGGQVEQQVEALLTALAKADLQYVITYPNADPGSEQIIEALKRFVAGAGHHARLVPNLGRQRYLSLLPHVRLMIGNSSSGLVEAPSFALPVVNVGSRQAGRLRGDNVIDVECRADAILAGIETALARDRSAPCVNPYGDGRASPRIVQHIVNTFRHRSRDAILRKRFVDEPAWPARPDHVGGGFDLDLSILADPPRQEPEHYFDFGPYVLFPAWGRSALRFVLDDLALGADVLLVPDHLCADVLLPVLRAARVAWRFYPVRADLTIDASALRTALGPDVGAVLFIDYYGFGEHRGLAAAVRSWQPTLRVIEDRVQAMFATSGTAGEAEPDYAFGSFRKFLPVPDGAFVRARRPFRPGTAVAPVSGERLSALAAAVLKRRFLDGGMDAVRAAAIERTYVDLFARAAADASDAPTATSTLSRELLRRLPLDEIAARRIANYRFLAGALSGVRGLAIQRDMLPSGAVPFALPVMVADGARDELRRFLANRRCFCPVHWPTPPEEAGAGALALSRDGLSLPIDQRYGTEPLERLARAIREFFGA
jgi:UDP-hydrolysing UDP-N-acetyl-D-glucosamine 2-epimerase